MGLKRKLSTKINENITKACNFYFGLISKDKVKKKLSIPLHGNNLISFDTIELISRKEKKIIDIKKICKLKTK